MPDIGWYTFLVRPSVMVSIACRTILLGRHTRGWSRALRWYMCGLKQEQQQDDASETKKLTF